MKLDCLLQYVLQWLNPHNWYLMMFSPATIHVLPFDPQHGSDNARVYAGKYASKPEKACRNFLVGATRIIRWNV